MPHRLSFVLFGMLISCTAFATGLDPVRVGRYSAIVPGPSPEQADPFALPIDTEFSYYRADGRSRAETGARTQWLPLSKPRRLLSLVAHPAWLAFASGAPDARAHAPR